jgi:hypothetical protein
MKKLFFTLCLSLSASFGMANNIDETAPAPKPKKVVVSPAQTPTGCEENKKELTASVSCTATLTYTNGNGVVTTVSETKTCDSGTEGCSMRNMCVQAQAQCFITSGL